MTMPETTQSDLAERLTEMADLYRRAISDDNGDAQTFADAAAEITRLRAHCDAMVAAVDNWDGLARSIMMAFDCGAKTPRAIFKHLSMVGQPIPKWMRDEAEMQNLDHTISKGTRCVLIYRAMAEPAVAAYRKEGGA